MRACAKRTRSVGQERSTQSGGVHAPEQRENINQAPMIMLEQRTMHIIDMRALQEQESNMMSIGR